MLLQCTFCFFSPLGKLAGRAIYFTFRNCFLFFFFFLLFSFFNDFSKKNYLRIRWTDFRNLFTEWKCSGYRWFIWTSFFDISRNIAMATDFVKHGKLLIFVALSFRNGMGYCYLNERVNSANDACILCENFVKFGPVGPNSRVDRAHLWTSGTTQPKTGVFRLFISGSTGQISTIFTPYESALRADDEFVAYFPICQGTLQWQPNNVAKMLTTPTDTTCIRCTSARKRIAISWSSCAH